MRVAKWGNSLAVRLSKELLEQLGLKPGNELTIVAASKQRLTVGKNDLRANAIEAIAKLNWTLPERYKFNRDEVSKR